MTPTQKLIEALDDAKGLLAHAGCPTYFIDTAIAAAKQEQQAEPDDDVSPLKDRALYALQTLQTDKHLPPTVRENMFDCVREAIQAAQPAPEVPAGCLWAVTKGGHTICQPPKNWGRQPAPEVPSVP